MKKTVNCVTGFSRWKYRQWQLKKGIVKREIVHYGLEQTTGQLGIYGFKYRTQHLELLFLFV